MAGFVVEFHFFRLLITVGIFSDLVDLPSLMNPRFDE